MRSWCMEAMVYGSAFIWPCCGFREGDVLPDIRLGV